MNAFFWQKFSFLVLPKHLTRTDHGTAVGVRGRRDGFVRWFVRSQRGAREAHARGGARRAPPRAGARWPAEDAATRIAAPGGESGCDRHPLLNPGWPAGGASRGLASAPPTDRDAADSVVMGTSSPPSRPRLMQRTRRGRRVRCVKGATSRRPKTAKPSFPRVASRRVAEKFKIFRRIGRKSQRLEKRTTTDGRFRNSRCRGVRVVTVAH